MPRAIAEPIAHHALNAEYLSEYWGEGCKGGRGVDSEIGCAGHCIYMFQNLRQTGGRC